MSAFNPRVCAAAIAPLLAVSGVMLTAWPAQAASPNIVISEVYGGGGNSGSTWTNDFVELFNRSDAAIDVSGWNVQYYSATGSVGGNASLTGSVAPHHSFLVQMAPGAGGTTPLPTPDGTGTAVMSAASGRVDLLQADTTVVDRVGYGAATVAEGTPAPGLGNTTRPPETPPASIPTTMPRTPARRTPHRRTVQSTSLPAPSSRP